MNNKMPSMFEGVSFQLAKLGIIVALILGMVMSAIQLYFDFRDQSKDFDKLMSQIIQLTMPAATRSVDTLDVGLASEIANGLMAYDFIYYVTIKDDSGGLLAERNRPLTIVENEYLYSLVSEREREFTTKLNVSGYQSNIFGELVFGVDTTIFFSGYFSRLKFNFLIGLLRDVLLVFCLFVIFHIKLTNPLMRISRELNEIDPELSDDGRLTLLPAKRRDELVSIITNNNKLFDILGESFRNRRIAGESLRKSQESLRQIIDVLPVLISARDLKGHYLFANKRLKDTVGFDESGDIAGLTVNQLLGSTGQDVEKIINCDTRVILKREEIDIVEDDVLSVEGDKLCLQTHMVPLDYYGEVVSLSVSVDISERKKVQKRMEHMVHHDVLTGLPNRLRLVDRLELEIEKAKNNAYYGAVLFIDLDNFKSINDSLGHSVGDYVLQEIALKLRSTVREEDLVSRLSGDEFVVVLSCLDKNLKNSTLKAADISEKIRDVVAQPFKYEGTDIRMTASIGIAVFPDEDNMVQEFLRYADAAMYQVKEAGRNAIKFFNKNMAENARLQLIVEGELLKAYEEQQFELYYQPKINAHTGVIVGAEALLRWNHPVRGVVSPFEFIPALEKTGLIVEVGHWIIEQACKMLVYCDKAGFWQEGMRLSVNISPRQFHREGFSADVLKLLSDYDIPEKSLDMEVTESIVIDNLDDVVKIMSELSAAGVSFSLDDFGTGYSSISYLKILPVSTLKIDRSFIQDITHDHNDRVLVQTIITMGRLLGLEVVAEGVETRQQLSVLQNYECDVYQGYYHSMPLLFSDLENELKK